MLDGAKIDKKKHLVLSSPHPSPFSAARGFFNTGHFKQADEWIKERYGKGIDWMVQSADRVDKPSKVENGSNDDEPTNKKAKTDEQVNEAVDEVVKQELEQKVASVKARNGSTSQTKGSARKKSTKQRSRTSKAAERAAEHADKLRNKKSDSENRKKRRDNSKTIWE